MNINNADFSDTGSKLFKWSCKLHTAVSSVHVYMAHYPVDECIRIGILQDPTKKVVEVGGFYSHEGRCGQSAYTEHW